MFEQFIKYVTALDLHKGLKGPLPRGVWKVKIREKENREERKARKENKRAHFSLIRH